MRITSHFTMGHSFFGLFFFLSLAAHADTTWFDHYPVCSHCVGAKPSDTTIKISDLEKAPRTQNSVGGYWFAATDTANREALDSALQTRILAGASRDSIQSIGYHIQATQGIDANPTYAAYLDFKLGKGSGEDTLEPFVILGTKLSDVLGTQFSNFTGSSGLSFDYWTSAQSTFDFIRFEVKTNTDYRNEHILHGLALPATQGQWIKVLLKWTDLSLPDWVNYQATPDSLRAPRIEKMDQIRWVVQEPVDSTGTGGSGALAIDNVMLHGLRPWGCAAPQCVDNIQTHRQPRPQRFTLRTFKGQMEVMRIRGENPQGVFFPLVNLNGQQVKSGNESLPGVKVAWP